MALGHSPLLNLPWQTIATETRGSDSHCKVITTKSSPGFITSCDHVSTMHGYHVMQDDDGWEEFSEDVDDITQLLAPASAFPGELM